MARTINFVRERRRNLSRQEVDDRKILKVVTNSMFALGVLILVAVGARLFLLFQIESIKSEQKQVQTAIAQKEVIEEQYTIFVNKLKILTELFGKRKEKQEALAYFSSLFGPDVIISQLSYTAGDEILSFVLQASNIFTMEEVFNIISSSEVSARYPTIEKESLRRAPDGTYGMQVTLYFGDEPLVDPSAPPPEGELIEGDAAVAPEITEEVPEETDVTTESGT